MNYGPSNSAPRIPEILRTKQAMIEVGAGVGQYQPPTARQRLEAQKIQLTDALENVNAAIEALDANPGAEAVMDALRKCNI